MKIRELQTYNKDSMKFPELFIRHGVRISLSIAVLVMLLLNTTGVIHLGFINRLENFTYDVRLNLMMPATLDERIVIIDIDEKSLQEQGRWPWGRHKLAQMLDKLFEEYKVKVLGFDVVFAEKDDSSGLKSLEEIGDSHLKSDTNFRALVDQLRPKLDYDQLFADSIKGRNVVLGFYFLPQGRSQISGELPPPSFVDGSFKGKSIAFSIAEGYGANLPVLQKNAIAAGHFNPDPDEDGISRKVPMLMSYQGNYYEALSIAVARIALGVDKPQAGFAEGLGVNAKYAGLEWLKLGDKRIPVDENVAALIPYRGKQGSFPYVSASDVLNGKVSPEMLKDKIVLVGTTAPGLMDLRATPVQNVYAGVEIHANMIAGILDQNIKERPGYTLGAEFVMLLLAGLLLALLLPVLNPLWATALTAGILTVSVLFNLVVWQMGNLVLPLAPVLLLIGLIYVLNMSYGFFVESRGKRQLAGLFGQYVPPELVDEMSKDPDAFSLEGESRELTVLFSDVRGFTTISEGLDPKELTLLMNEFLTPMTHVIHHNRGTIDKYMGDAIMAFWNAPVTVEHHAARACDTASAMQARLRALNEEWKAEAESAGRSSPHSGPHFFARPSHAQKSVQPSLRRSFGSSACSSSVPKMAGSTSRQSAFAARSNTPISSRVRSKAVVFLKRPPLKWRMRASMTSLMSMPESISAQSRFRRRGNISGFSTHFPKRSRKLSAGRRPVSSANIVKRQRMRKCATSSGLLPRCSRPRLTSAR